ncbi:hypothetical protein ACFLRB_04405 [Acidobacteriota bacterium]
MRTYSLSFPLQPQYYFFLTDRENEDLEDEDLDDEDLDEDLLTDEDLDKKKNLE